MQEEFLTGYQWMDNGKLSGEYKFPNNKDQEDVHMPPNTTLIKPPKPLKNKEIYWTGQEWSYRPITQL
jgi:hypothetical protein